MANKERLDDSGEKSNWPLIWGREIPYRNPNFIGREDELEALRESLTSDPTGFGQPPQPVFGLGGVGKTELVAEYARRYRSEYSVVWWVRAEQSETVIISLLALGRRMEIPDFRDDEREYSLGLVMDALNRGVPYRNYLLIFDNASDSRIAEYVPSGPGHVIVTSRETQWQRALQVDGVEIREFKLAETVAYLRKCVPSLAAVHSEGSGRAGADSTSPPGAVEEENRRQALAVEIAEAIGNLPLVAAHAAAYLSESGISVQEYLQLYRHNAHQLLAVPANIGYPRSVATTWSMARGVISEEADVLFKLLAFFSSEPIYEELLLRPGMIFPGLEKLEQVLSDRSIFRDAKRLLQRYSMIRLDGVRNVIQVHRVVQQVTQGRLKREEEAVALAYRNAAHALLAASDPMAPYRDDSEQAYERSIQHLGPSGALTSANPKVRGLILNQVRRLCARGGHSAALNLARSTLPYWRREFGHNDRDTLALAVETAIAMRFSGLWVDAMELNADSLARLRKGEAGLRDENYLVCARSYGVDLTYLGRYQEALDRDGELLPLYAEVFGMDGLDTLKLRNNIALELRCLGRYSEALELDQRVLEGRRQSLSDRDTEVLTSRFAIARDYRRLGEYEDSLDIIREVDATLRGKNEPWNRHRLLIAADLGVALRFLGHYGEAAEQGEQVHRRHVAILGPKHRTTLRNAINLIADRRLVHDMHGGLSLGEETAAEWERLAGATHPNTVATRCNLAAVLHASGHYKSAIALQKRVVAEFIGIYGENHPDTLVARLNLGSGHAAIGEVRLARRHSEEAYQGFVAACGSRHPYTLSAGNNLANDRLASGDEIAARDLRAQVESAFVEVLGREHPDTRLCLQHGRILLDIEPMMN